MATDPQPLPPDPRPGADQSLHVVPHENGWAIRVEGEKAYAAIAPTKKETEKMARRLARERATSVVVHRADGTMQRRHDYS